SSRPWRARPGRRGVRRRDLPLSEHGLGRPRAPGRREELPRPEALPRGPHPAGPAGAATGGRAPAHALGAGRTGPGGRPAQPGPAGRAALLTGPTARLIPPTRESRLALLVVGGALAVAALALWWVGARDPDVPFFTPDRRAEWIVYPGPPVSVARPRVELETVFTRAFVLERAPARARLSVRLYRRGDVPVNGTPGPPAPGARQRREAAD